jgi:DNA-binding GntR family transcriptional regulator
MTDVPPLSSRGSLQEEAEVTVATERLFSEVVNGMENPWLSGQMARMNEIMRQVRPYEAALIPDRAQELEALAKAWAARDIERLQTLLQAYFERRKALVPELVKLINRPQ